MTITAPSGWKNFSGGTTDETLCDTGEPLALAKDSDLNCDAEILTANLTLTGGVPPYTWSTSGGMLTIIDPTHATLKIHTAIPNTHERCIALAYGYSGSGQGFNKDLCQENAAAFCVTDYFNCFGQWIQFVHLDGLVEDSCWDKVNSIPGPNYPRLGRFYNCPFCSNSDIGDCPVPDGCGLPNMNPDGIDVTSTCDSSILLQVQLPELLPPFYCFDAPALHGQDYVNFGSTFTIGVNPPTLGDGNSTAILRLGAQIFLHPEDALRTFDDVAGLNTLLSGCAPCQIIQGTSIIVTVTDALGNVIPIEVTVG